MYLKGSWALDYRVADVLALDRDTASKILFGEKVVGKDKQGNPVFGEHDRWVFYKPRKLKVTIDYPFNVPYSFELTPKRNEVITLGETLWEVAQAYEQAYQNREKHKPWGHAICDLFFENITVKKDGSVVLGIGS